MMLYYPDNVKAGDTVQNPITGDTYVVTDVHWRNGVGWEVQTRASNGYNGPTFYPHPDRMPDPDPYVSHPNDCGYCASGEPMAHNYEPTSN